MAHPDESLCYSFDVFTVPALIDPKSTRSFAALMTLYGENYRQLQMLYDPLAFSIQVYVSRAPGGLDLYLEPLAYHRFTSEIRLSYLIDGELDPAAKLRLYHDAQTAEVVALAPGPHFPGLHRGCVHDEDQLQRRWLMNRFLDKWLEYLLAGGHLLGRFTPLRDLRPYRAALAVAEPDVASTVAQPA